MTNHGFQSFYEAIKTCRSTIFRQYEKLERQAQLSAM